MQYLYGAYLNLSSVFNYGCCVMCRSFFWLFIYLYLFQKNILKKVSAVHAVKDKNDWCAIIENINYQNVIYNNETPNIFLFDCMKSPFSLELCELVSNNYVEGIL